MFRIVGDEPILSRDLFVDRSAVLPAAVLADGDTYHAWVVAFARLPGTQDIHHLTSPDAVTWTESPDASLVTLSDGLGDPGALPTSVLHTEAGWVMYLTGTLATEREGWEIWRATAPSADGPWTRGGEPVLRRGPAGAWDSGGLDFPTVLRTADGFVALYSGIASTNRETSSIGLATSRDGITWTKHDDPATSGAALAESDPVVAPRLCGGFDARAIGQPRVVEAGGRFVMAYAGYAGQLGALPGVGLAATEDLAAGWSCLWPGSALDPTGLPTGNVHTLNAFTREGRLALLVEWFARSGTDVWLAEASQLPG